MTSIKIYHFLLKPSFHITAALNGSEDITLAFDSLNICCLGIWSWKIYEGKQCQKKPSYIPFAVGSR